MSNCNFSVLTILMVFPLGDKKSEKMAIAGPEGMRLGLQQSFVREVSFPLGQGGEDGFWITVFRKKRGGIPLPL